MLRLQAQVAEYSNGYCYLTFDVRSEGPDHAVTTPDAVRWIAIGGANRYLFRPESRLPVPSTSRIRWPMSIIASIAISMGSAAHTTVAFARIASCTAHNCNH